MTGMINKTMDRSDLLAGEAKPTLTALDRLIETIYSTGLFMTSWYGSLPAEEGAVSDEHLVKRALAKIPERRNSAPIVGIDNRGSDYEPLPGATDDARLPWYLYWEIFWLLRNGPRIDPQMRLLDAGGTSSLFTCYLASLGCLVHSIDLNERLVANADQIASVMGWQMFSYAMDMQELHFENEYFDHAYSICVFEHLDLQARQLALGELARCLKPNGTLSITFDYRNPAPYMAKRGPAVRAEDQLTTPDDIRRSFLSTGYFELVGNHEFFDNGQSYLVHPTRGKLPYTFGAIFLRKK